MTRLQIALDLIDREAALDLLEALALPKGTIIEAGTPFLLRYGVAAAAELKGRFPHCELLCDAKILDAGMEETSMLVSAGADWVTVMARTDEATIRACVETAHLLGARVMADMLGVADLPGAARRMGELGADCAAIHVGVDRQALGDTPLASLERLTRADVGGMIAVAGGIGPDSAADYLACRPDILIVGGGILNSPDPAGAARRIYEQIRESNAES